MRVAVSNIAWQSEEEPHIADLLKKLSVDAVEIAPTAVWPDPTAVDAAERKRYRSFWEERGCDVVAFQALLYGHPELTLFDDESARRQTEEYLKRVLELGASLGAKAFVFGSPKNRLVGDLPREKADSIATAFFSDIGRIAHDLGVVLCIEPNPTQYGCDFVTTAREGIDLVSRVDHPGFRLHLDTGGMTLAGDSPEVIAEAVPWLGHFHVSEPELAPVGAGQTDHQAMGAALRSAGYAGIVSIEMRSGEQDNLGRVSDAVATAKRYYG